VNELSIPYGIIEPAMSARARVRISHKRPYDFDEKRKLYLFKPVDEDEVVENLVTNPGRVYIHTQAYWTSPGANGLNYIAITDDSGAPAQTDTVLTSELSGNGLTRAQGTVTLPTGSGTQTTIAKTFTYGGTTQAVQKSALFSAASSGTMAHEVQWTERTLFNLDTLTVTYTITLT